MPFGKKISSWLLAQMDAIEGNPELWGISPAGMQLTEVIAHELVRSREEITENRFSTMESLLNRTLPESIEYVLDAHYSREVVEAISGYVNRTMELSRFDAVTIPSKVTASFLREAIQAFVFGLPQASIALSRAALEQALKENIGYQSTKTYVEYKQLFDEAEGAKVLDGGTRKKAEVIVKVGSDVLHERTSKTDEALDVLITLRDVLQTIYAN